MSDHHCEILVRLQRKGDRLIAGIRDTGSRNGTLLNDEDLNYDMHNCVNEDVITVGFNYRMVLLLVDPAKYGLGAAPDFQAAAQQMPPMPSMPDMNATHQRNVNVNINMNETQPDIPFEPHQRRRYGHLLNLKTSPGARISSRPGPLSPIHHILACGAGNVLDYAISRNH